MRITIFGASGKVGRLLVEGALEAGHEVTAFVHHSPGFPEDSRLRVVQGDIHDARVVEDAVKGSEVVMSALGSWGTSSKDIVSSGMANIIPAMKAAGIGRIISLTGADARTAGDELSPLHRLTHALIRLGPPRRILADGERHLRLLENSGLDWTVVRSPVMNDRGDPSRYKLAARRPPPWATINRRSVALSMLVLASGPGYPRNAPFISRD